MEEARERSSWNVEPGAMCLECLVCWKKKVSSRSEVVEREGGGGRWRGSLEAEVSRRGEVAGGEGGGPVWPSVESGAGRAAAQQ